MTIHPTALVAPGAEIGADAEVGPYCIVGGDVRIGAGTRLHSHVVIEGQTEIGPGCDIYPFAILGSPPQHAAYRDGDPGRLVVGARNLIREHVTMHRGSSVGLGVTTVGDDCTFYVGTHVGHDCVVGNHVTMTNSAMVGGHVRVDDYVIMGGLSAVQQRSRVGRCAFVGGLAAVNSDVIPYGMVWGNHARLEGLNLIGLKRRGFSRNEINTMRAGFRAIFSGHGVFRDRVDAAAEIFSDSPQVMEIIAFIREDPTRPLILASSQG